MACDLPEHYMIDGKIHPAFQFITDVGVDWETSKVLDGEIGDYVVIARKEKGSANWFVGGVTDENNRTLSVNFDFLDNDTVYEATVYKDAAEAHYNTNPEAYKIEKMDVRKGEKLDIDLAPGGGFAISLIRK